MAFSGNLKTMPLVDLLQWAANGRQTGTIKITGEEIAKMIYIREGEIVSCTSTDPREFLGHFLVSKGAIDEGDLRRAIAIQGKRKGLLGQILVQQGAISQEQLTEMLQLKAEEAIFDLFTWEKGEFSFLDGELPNYEMVPISLDVTGLVMEGMRRLDEWQLIAEVIPSSLCVPVAVGPLVAPGDDDDPGRISVLEAVDDDRSIEDICLHTHSSEFFVCDILFKEIKKGRLKVVRPRFLPQENKLTTVAATSGTSSEALVQAAREKLGAGDLERAVRFLQAAGSLEPTNQPLQDTVKALGAKVRERLLGSGVELSSVPALVTSLEELSSMELTPNEGFILSRIDGRCTVEAIIQISPLSEIDALLVIWKLLDGGHIRL
jgi:hypothetical protein